MHVMFRSGNIYMNLNRILILLGLITLSYQEIACYQKIYWLTFWPDHINTLQTLKPNFAYYFLRKFLKKSGYMLEPRTQFTDDMLDGAYIIIFDGRLASSDLLKIPKEKRILYLHEPPSIFPLAYEKEYHALYSKVFTWDREMVDNKKYFHFYSMPLPSFHMITNTTDFNNKKLCCLMANKKNPPHDQLDAARIAAIDFFEYSAPNEFDLYGGGNWSPSLTCYKGYTLNKIETMKNYKFYLCYENTIDIRDYISEKIFECFQAGTVPVYWGACNVTDYIPKNCFIDRRDFASMNELYQYLKCMKKEEYQLYIDNIKQFLASDLVHEFSYDRFIEEIVFGLFS
jgi:alpha(1,3/1,4) fucosyltransferase